ncbi:MAG: histidine kinase [Rhodospirillales bacterium]|nr:histidine kinase [Rhodospirillales bacterium]
MRLIDLLRTGSFRLALLFLALFGIASMVLFGFLYLQTHEFVIANIDAWLGREAPKPFRSSVAEIERSFAAHAANNQGMEHVFVLYGPDGQILAGNPLPMPTDIATFDRPFNFQTQAEERRMRHRGIAHRMEGGDIVLIAQDMYETREFDEAFISTMLWGGALTVGLGLLGATLVGAGTARRLDDVALAIQRIVSGDLSRRLPSRGTAGDLDRLAHVVNGMLDDIERLMHEVKGVADGIAHDLRTPLTRILAGLERAQRRAASPEAYAAAIDDAIFEIRGVLKTFSALLRIAELEDGARRMGFSAVDLRQVARDVIEFYEPVAEEKEILLQLSCTDSGPIMLNGDASLLFDAMANLIDNAIKFTPARGRVTVELDHAAEGIVIGIKDTGHGIAAPEREAVLRRFYRSEQSRHTPGNGLGLALVSAIARLHDLTLAIEDASPGCCITLRQTRPALPSMI